MFITLKIKNTESQKVEKKSAGCMHFILKATTFGSHSHSHFKDENVEGYES